MVQRTIFAKQRKQFANVRAKRTNNPTTQNTITTNKSLHSTYIGIGHIRSEILQGIQQGRKSQFHVPVRHGSGVQGRQQATGEFSFPGSLVHGEGNCLFEDFPVVLLVVQFEERANDFVAVAGIKVFLDAVGHLNFELAEGQHGTVDGFGFNGIVAAGFGAIVGRSMTGLCVAAGQDVSLL